MRPRKLLLLILHNMKEKLKKILSQKKVLLISAVVLLIFLLFFLGMSIFGPWWKVWPASIRFNIAFNRLAISVYENPYCHLDCYLDQQVYETEIISSLDKNKVQNKISKAIFNEEENINWRLKLLDLVFQQEKLSTWPLFQNLQLYLTKNEANIRVQNVIASNLALNGFDVNYIEKLKLIVSNQLLEFNERSVALKILGAKNKSLADFYFQLLSEEGSDDLKMELLRAFGSDETRFDLDRKEVALVLREIILQENSSFSTRRLAIFVLSDFLSEEFEDEIVLIFNELISDLNLDIFTKYLLIDTLILKFPQQTKLNEIYILPEIEASDWDIYYGQK